MKKLFAVILIILVNSIFALSQIEIPKTADWQIFAPTIEEFSVEVPIKFSVAKNDENSLFKDLSRDYWNNFDGTYFYIFSDNPARLDNLEQVRNFIKAYNKDATGESDGNLGTEKFKFSDSEDFHYEINIVRGKSRTYVFQTISPTKDNPLVEHFFKSIKINDNSSIETNIKPEKNQDNITTTPKNIQLKPTNGSGSGMGNGRGSQTNPETKSLPTPTQKNETRGIRLLTKPKALYTDFARFYNISGRVALRVTFLADGTISSVDIASKLPCGLTQQAIIAAKGITFDPAMREGIPYSVTKMVEYSFTIY
jgi:Gram-negative bacterial TonB protein C-terminal